MDGKELSAIIEFARDLEDVNKALWKALNMLESLQNDSYYQRLKENELHADEKAILSEWLRANRSNPKVAPTVLRESDMRDFSRAIEDFFQ